MTDSSREKKVVRVLQVVGGMNRGGTETWLMHVLRRLDREHFRFDFLVHDDATGAYDEEIRRLGGRVIPCTKPGQWSYERRLRGILRSDGPYQVVHSHMHHFSGRVLKAAAASHVPIRIAHSHLDTSGIDGRAGLVRRWYLAKMRGDIRQYATRGFACSELAAPSLFGSDWRADGRWSVLHCGLDFTPFAKTFERGKVRRELGIPEGSLVVGHVGRFVSQKNHAFLLEVFAALVRRRPSAFLLLIGDGPDRHEMERKAQAIGIADRTLFLGVRSDVPRIMKGAMDLFVFPSSYEGLGLVVVEAQAAGLPVVAADTVPTEAKVRSRAVEFLPLRLNATAWAERALELAETEDCALSCTAEDLKAFDLDLCMNRLLESYGKG